MPWTLMSLWALNTVQHLRFPPATAQMCTQGRSSTLDSSSPICCSPMSFFAAELLRIGKRISSVWSSDPEVPSGLSFICPQNSDSTDSNFNLEQKTPEELTGADEASQSIQLPVPVLGTMQQFPYFLHNPVSFILAALILCLYLATFWQ